MTRGFDWPVVVFLLQNYGQDICITENVLRASVGNWKVVEALLHLLIQGRGDEIQIAKGVIQVAGKKKQVRRKGSNEDSSRP